MILFVIIYMSFQRSSKYYLNPQNNRKSSSVKYLKQPDQSQQDQRKPLPNKKPDGPYASIPQRVYQPIKKEQNKNQQNKNQRSTEGEYVIEEEVFGREVSSDKIYDFNLSAMEFLEHLDQSQSSTTRPPKIQTIDQYHLYQFIHSIKNGESVIYTEEELEHRWSSDTRRYYRKIVRTYQNAAQMSDLDSYQDYHLVVRIVRFQLNRRIFELIIPRNHRNASLYQPADNFFQLLSQHNLKLLNLPNETQFMIRQAI